MSARLRVVVVSLAVLAVFFGVTAVGYVYINHAAVGIGRVPVMFVVRPARTPAASR